MKEEQALLEITDGGEFIFGYRNDGIIHIYFRKNTIVDLAVKEKIRNLVHARFGYRDMAYIYQTGGNVLIRISALRDSRLLDESMPSIGRVLVLEHLFSRLLAKAYLLIWPCEEPVKIVSDFSRGIHWLRKRKSEFGLQDN